MLWSWRVGFAWLRRVPVSVGAWGCGQALTFPQLSLDVPHGVLGGGWRRRKTTVRLRQLWQRVWQEELPSGRGSSLRTGHDPEKVSPNLL